MKTGLMSQRLGLLQFLNAVINPKIGLISWWSRERSAKIWIKDQNKPDKMVLNDNPNQKSYKADPTISNSDLHYASEWHKKDFRIKAVDEVFIMSSDSYKKKYKNFRRL